MRIKIRDIPDEGQDWEEPLSESFLRDALEGLGADLSQTHATAKLLLYKAGSTVIAQGKLTGVVAVPCSRCLGLAALLIDVPMRIIFAPEDEMPDEKSVGDEDDLCTHDYNFIVLDDVLREAVILAVPMTPLCREDCKGLCAACGKDRNLVDCGCDTRPPDPRFAVLQSLKV